MQCFSFLLRRQVNNGTFPELLKNILALVYDLTAGDNQI